MRSQARYKELSCPTFAVIIRSQKLQVHNATWGLINSHYFCFFVNFESWDTVHTVRDIAGIGVRADKHIVYYFLAGCLSKTHILTCILKYIVDKK